MAGFNFNGFFSRMFNRGLNFWAKPFDGSTDFLGKLTPNQKLELILRNPAFLKVAALQCDMFSLGKFYAYKDGKELASHPVLDLLAEPNPFQNGAEFLWEFMFWQMLGVSYVYVDTDDLDRLIGNKLYLLKPYGVEYPAKFEADSDKIILSSAKLKEWRDTKLLYRYNDGTSIDVAMSSLEIFPDLANTYNRATFNSRVDAILKPIQNNEASMDAMNINIRYTGKFMVSSTTNDINSTPLAPDEKKNIEDNALNDKQVQAVKTPIDIKRFVERAGEQKLDGFWLHTYFVIGTMFNIPRDVLEAFNSSTYENQEKARGAHVSYCLQPKADTFTQKLSKRFGLTAQGITLYLDWEHLPFMQVFAEQRSRAQYTTTQSILNLQKAGVSMDQINEYLDTKFTAEAKTTTV